MTTITCPSCGHPNVQGTDQCEECLYDLSSLQIREQKPTGVHSILSDPVEVLFPHDPILVWPDDPVKKVIQVMLDRKVGCVLVSEGENLVGIFTERDVLMKIANVPGALDRPVKNFMVSDPESLSLSAPLAFVLNKMDLGEYRHVPVVSHGSPVGIVSIKGVLGYIADYCKSKAAEA
ncbi:MAG: CBS domain-containing protein [bacterium]